MVTGLTADLSQPLPLLGIYSSARPKHTFWAVAFLQIGLCITTSLFLSYYFYNRLHSGGKMSWTKAISVSNPIRKRLQNLEKERAIWKYYLHWMEDYFFVYCDLLKFLNKTTLDVEKVYKDHVLGLSQIVSSGSMSESAANLSKICENQSDSSLESNTSDDDLQLIASFARVLAHMTSDDNDKTGSDSVKPIFDPGNAFTLDVTSGDDTNEESNENESESIPVSNDDELNVLELMDLEFLNDENNSTQGDGIFPLSDGSAIDEIEA